MTFIFTKEKDTVKEGKMAKKKKKIYAHNPRYCMILPDASKDKENIASTGQS